MQPSTSTTLAYIHEQLDVDEGDEALHREPTLGNGMASIGSIGADLAAAHLSAVRGVPSRWVTEESSDDSDDEEAGRQLPNGRDHSADDEHDSIALLHNGQHQNGLQEKGGRRLSDEDGSDDDYEPSEVAASPTGKSGGMRRAASKGKLVQVRLRFASRQSPPHSILESVSATSMWQVKSAHDMVAEG